jgi:hypothetical protein
MGFLSAIPFAKIIYSAVLIGLIVVLAREAIAVWWSDRLYVGKFVYFADGKADDAQSTAFPALILSQHQLLRAALIAEKNRRDEDRKVEAPPGAEVYVGLPKTLPEAARWQSVLSDAELKIQGFDLGKLLSLARTHINPPDEISGFVEKSGTVVRASLNWPSRHALSTGAIVSPFETGQLANDSSVAFAVAANMVWAEAAADDATFAKIPREAFVGWALTWWDLRQIQARKALGEPPADEDKKRWSQVRRLVDRIIDQAPRYPEIWRLRADIIAAAYDGLATDKDKDLAKDDLQRYAAAIGAAASPTVPIAASYVPPMAPAADVRPGAVVWIRAAGGRPDAPFGARVTLTAIVTDAAGQRKLLLPAYAIAGESEFATSPTGPVIARAGTRDILYADAKAESGSPGVVLANMEKSVAATNDLDKAKPLKASTKPPQVGDLLILYSTGITVGGPTQRQAKVKGIIPPLIAMDSRISEPGDGGAPVLDAAGNLVAMGYIGNETESRLLPLTEVLAKGQLKLLE